MALLIRGKSRCHLCGEVMGTADEVTLFPPGLFEPDSDLAHLNDSTVHTACLNERPDSAEARRALGEYVRVWGSGNVD